VRGGVAGWLAQRVPQPAAPTTARRSATPPKAVSKKSPSTLRRQLAIADRAVAEAIAARNTVQAELLAASTNHAELVRLGAELATSQSQVDAAEERWLSLADEAESLEMEF